MLLSIRIDTGNLGIFAEPEILCGWQVTGGCNPPSYSCLPTVFLLRNEKRPGHQLKAEIVLATC